MISKRINLVLCLIVFLFGIFVGRQSIDHKDLFPLYIKIDAEPQSEFFTELYELSVKMNAKRNDIVMCILGTLPYTKIERWLWLGNRMPLYRGSAVSCKNGEWFISSDNQNIELTPHEGDVLLISNEGNIVEDTNTNIYLYVLFFKDFVVTYEPKDGRILFADKLQ